MAESKNCAKENGTRGKRARGQNDVATDEDQANGGETRIPARQVCKSRKRMVVSRQRHSLNDSLGTALKVSRDVRAWGFSRKRNRGDNEWIEGEHGRDRSLAADMDQIDLANWTTVRTIDNKIKCRELVRNKL